MEQAEQLRLEGVIESIIFHSEETGFTVMEVAVDDELVTVVGESMELSPGEEIAATGTFTAHPSYGRQFKASCFERVMPATAAAMLRYLSGGAVRGIGPALAQKIVAKFGDRSLEVLENDPARLAQIRGISPKKAVELGEAFRRILGVRAVMEFLAARGIGAATARRLVEEFGADTFTVLEEHPEYLTRIKGITRKRALQIGDAFRLQMGMRLLLAFLGEHGLPLQLGMPLYRRYGNQALDVLQDNPAFAGFAPKTLHHRFLTEDTPYSMVPMAALGRLAGVPTPIMDALIALLGELLGEDYAVTGQTAERMGLAGMTPEAIRNLVSA